MGWRIVAVAIHRAFVRWWLRHLYYPTYLTPSKGQDRDHKGHAPPVLGILHARPYRPYWVFLVRASCFVFASHHPLASKRVQAGWLLRSSFSLISQALSS